MKLLQIFLLFCYFVLSLSITADQVVSCARSQLGKPYAVGGIGPDKFDSAGLVYYCHGGKVGKTPMQLFNSGAGGEPKPGNVIIFGEKGNGVPKHVGIIIGDNKMIHVADNNRVRTVSYYPSEYWQPRVIALRRYYK